MIKFWKCFCHSLYYFITISQGAVEDVCREVPEGSRYQEQVFSPLPLCPPHLRHLPQLRQLTLEVGLAGADTGQETFLTAESVGRDRSRDTESLTAI